MIILDAFLLQFAALLRGEFVLIAALFGPRRPALMIDEERLAIVRAFAVRTAFHLHLQEAKVDPELQLGTAIQPRNFPDFDRAELVRPIFQKRV